MVVASHAYEYEKRAGPVNQMSIEMFTQTLAQELRHCGYKVGLSQKWYWDYYKKRQKPILDRTDVILRIKLKQMGSWSPGFMQCGFILWIGYYSKIFHMIGLVSP